MKKWKEDVKRLIKKGRKGRRDREAEGGKERGQEKNGRKVCEKR